MQVTPIMNTNRCLGYRQRRINSEEGSTGGNGSDNPILCDLESRLFRKLQMIDDATTDQDLRVPTSNHFEKLRGRLDGCHSIRVNNQWRLVFRWDRRRGEASNVYLDDHSYR